MLKAFIGNDLILRVQSLQYSDGTYQNNATVTGTLKTHAGVEVLGQSWPLTLTYVTSSNGNYEGQLDHEIQIIAGRTYILHVTAISVDDKYMYKPLEVLALNRGASE